MKSLTVLLTLLMGAQPLLCMADGPKVVVVKQFTGIYPASDSLHLPFHGCVELDKPLPEGSGEYWLSLGHLIRDADFKEIEVLVDSARTILGARATFKGTEEEWRGERGYESRKRVLSAFSGGDGSELSKELPLAFDAEDFGDMVYAFDRSGHVTWRKRQGCRVMAEADYVKSQERHKRECRDEGCKHLDPSAHVILKEGMPSQPTDGENPSPLRK